MSVVTHVIPAQSFTDGQIINLVTPALSQPQDLVVTQSSTVVPVALNQTVQVEAKVDLEQEKQKQAIYNHPLFPLMVLMFERCEQASGSHDFAGNEGLDADIHAFVQHQEKEKKSFYSNNSELDQLMIKSIQVLRIHLLELEKVTELCKDFCTRYTSCLKGKLQSENLLRTESDYDQSMFDEPPPETSSSVQQVHGIVNTSAAPNVILGQQFHSPMSAMPTLNPGQIMSGGTVYQMVQTPQGLVAQPIQIQTSMASLATPMIHGGTPISQIGVPAPPTSTANSTTGASTNSLGSGSGFDSDDEDNGKKRTKRGVLPKSATQVMKSWLFQHIVHPYPTEDEKRQIAAQTNLTLLQVNNWFINARRRILQPMLDAGNPETLKAKKTKPQSKPPQRFWPFSSSGDKTPTSTSTEAVVTSATSPSIAGLGQTIVLPPGAFVTPDGQIVNLQGSSMAAMLTQVKQSRSPSPSPADKDSSDNNNNSHNTDNEHSEAEDLT